MRYVSTVIGAAISGVFVFGVWGLISGTYGIFGGWIAGMVIIGMLWTMNHYAGVMYNPAGAPAVDMACGIAIAGTSFGVFDGLPIAAAMPTIIILLIGGSLGGAVAGLATKAIDADQG